TGLWRSARCAGARRAGARPATPVPSEASPSLERAIGPDFAYISDTEPLRCARASTGKGYRERRGGLRSRTPSRAEVTVNEASRGFIAVACTIALGVGPACAGGERTERFDRDPGWEGHHNESLVIAPRTIHQDFGYSPGTRHAGGSAAGEIG